MSINDKPLIILTGPTAVGKTDLSINLAKAVGGSIISADSMQVYKYMDIGTAKITKEEMDGVKHFLVDELDPRVDFDVTLFQKKSKEAIDQIYSEGKVPIIVGGTGFYIQAVLYDIQFDSGLKSCDDGAIISENDNKNVDVGKDEALRNELSEYARVNGNEALHKMLEKIDEESAKAIHFNNVKRVIRAIEYYKLTGEKISVHNKRENERVSPYNFAYFVLNDDRDKLYERINKRVDIMFDMGLENEFNSLIELGLTRDMVSMHGIGYRELFDYAENKISLEEAKELIKQDTRHLAKRQITWFKREKEVTWFNYQDYKYDKKYILNDMLDFLRQRNIIN